MAFLNTVEKQYTVIIEDKNTSKAIKPTFLSLDIALKSELLTEAEDLFTIIYKRKEFYNEKYNDKNLRLILKCYNHLLQEPVNIDVNDFSYDFASKFIGKAKKFKGFVEVML